MNVHDLFLSPLPLLSRYCFIQPVFTFQFIPHNTTPRPTSFLSSYSPNPLTKSPNFKSSASDAEIYLGDDEGAHMLASTWTYPHVFFWHRVLPSQTSVTYLFQGSILQETQQKWVPGEPSRQQSCKGNIRME